MTRPRTAAERLAARRKRATTAPLRREMAQYRMPLLPRAPRQAKANEVDGGRGLA